jgi:hypothetical protein
VWSPHQSQFDRGLAELAAYVEANGTARMPDGYKTADGFGLGVWCRARRQEKNTGHLTAERVAALDALGFIWDPWAEAFDLGMATLVEYVRTHGDASVPSDYRTENGFNLGKWCSHRRNDYRDGRLSPERVEKLQALGFVWNLVKDRFERGLAELAAYVAEQGNARVPQDYKTHDGYKLGTWCAERRTDQRLGRLSTHREAQLDELGFVWSAHQRAFERGLAELAAYVEEFEDADVPQHYTAPSGFNLGTWCSARRQQRKADKLSTDRIALLDALGFPWESRGRKDRTASAVSSSTGRER